MSIQRTPPRSAVESSNLADVLERILDKGVIIAGDIRISLVNVELLTIQLRLVICSIDKAKEMGMDWWVNNPIFNRQSSQKAHVESSLDKIVERVENLEKSYRDVQSQTSEKST